MVYGLNSLRPLWQTIPFLTRESAGEAGAMNLARTPFEHSQNISLKSIIPSLQITQNGACHQQKERIATHNHRANDDGEGATNQANQRTCWKIAQWSHPHNK